MTSGGPSKSQGRVTSDKERQTKKSRQGSARAKRDFANVTLLWVKNCQNIRIKLARCLILSVGGFDQTLWRPSCRETAKGRLGTLSLGKQCEYAFCSCQHLYRPLSRVHSFLSGKKIKDFAGPVGDTPQVTLRKSCLAPAERRGQPRQTHL